MNRIKELRKSEGMNQIDLANLLGISQQAVSTYENSTSEIDSTTLKILSDQFNVSIDYLLGETAIEEKYDEADKFISALKENLTSAGYDFSEKSAKEISEIVTMALSLANKIMCRD